MTEQLTPLLRLKTSGFSAVLNDDATWTLERGKKSDMFGLSSLISHPQEYREHGGHPDVYGIEAFSERLKEIFPDAEIEVLYEYPASNPDEIY